MCVKVGKSQWDVKRRRGTHREREGDDEGKSQGPDPICEPCLAGKMHANPFPSSKNRSTRLLELVHTDVHKVGTPTHSGYQYWVTFIDDFSRFCVVIPIKTKDMTFDAFFFFFF